MSSGATSALLSNNLDSSITSNGDNVVELVGTGLAVPLAVQETGGSLKVHTDTPHLVSLGGGRLSTAVTLHPLPSGRVTLGCGNHVDIPVHGTGVEPVHCHIENINGVVTLYPIAQAITIDGLSVVSPTRLAQGVIITIGRSNYMRFNHPAEAKLMKSVLPNTRISMGPIQFSNPTTSISEPNVEHCNYNNNQNNNRKPPAVPKKPTTFNHQPTNVQDTWESSSPEDNTILSKVSKFELFATQHLKKKKVQLLSPKVFPADLITVNTPAKDVLGKSPPSTKNFNLTKNLQNSAVNYNENSLEKNSLSVKARVAIHENGCIPKLNNIDNNYNSKNFFKMSQSYHYQPNSNVDELQKNYVNYSMSQSMYTTPTDRSPCSPNNNSCNKIKQLNTSNNNNRLTTPSPCFNRNPSAYRNGAWHPVNNSDYATIKTTNLNDEISEIKSDRNLCRTNNTNVITSEYERNEAEIKRNQVQEERLREQEIEKAEQARLEEILNMCAEYEKQVQHERTSMKSVPTPNRIKTNGSLPRDKRSPTAINTSGGSSGNQSLHSGNSIDQESVFKFDFDNIHSMLSNSNSNWSPDTKSQISSKSGIREQSYENVSIVSRFPSSPMTVHKNSLPSAKSQHSHTPHYENVHLQNGQSSTNFYPQSPRTRIKTYVTANKHDTYKNDVQSYKEDYDYLEQFVNNTKALFDTPPRNLMNKMQQHQEQQHQEQLHTGNINNHQTDQMTTSTPNSIQKISDYFMNENILHEISNVKINKQNIETNKVEQKSNDLNSDTIMDIKQDEKSIEVQNNNITIQKQEEKNRLIENLTVERNQIQNSISNVKQKITDIEMQEEELLRELELEKSLISGEFRSEMSALKELEKGKISLLERAKLMEHEMENCRILQERQQAESKAKLEDAQNTVVRLQSEMEKYTDNKRSSINFNELEIKLSKAHDNLENERKVFEDLEFHHLEEEANLLATREELQREIQDLSQKIETKKQQIFELEVQQNEAFDHTTRESKELERTLIGYLRNLEEYRNRLKIIDTELETLTGQKLDYYSDNELLSDDDTDSSLRSQLRNKLENIQLLRNQLSSMENENRTNSIHQKKSSQDDSVIIGSNNIICKTSTIDIMSQSFHEMFLNDKYSPDVRFKLTQECKSPSQDDIDRISKVTSQAPMDLGDNTGSLGRKTIESLKEIERVRQIHLVQQGSQVIEQERKRVSELKRRVQDEVRAQWEERKRECNSLNSVGSEESGLTSSEGITRESVAESEDIDDKIKHNVTFDGTQLNNNLKRRNSQAENGDADSDSHRPLSESSDISYDTQSVKMRNSRRNLSSPQQRPLTRYLPIRNDNLNLKQHIESAGHQVDLCSQVILDSTTCRGYLNKMGSRFHSWNKRWFVFDRVKRMFIYYSDRNEKKPRGGAYFQAIEEVYVDHLNTVKSPNPLLTFIVKTHERSYHLMAPTSEAMRIWIDVIFTGAEGYQEFEHGT